MTEEIWKDILNYEGLYQISNLGNVKSLGNKHKHKNSIILKQTIDRKNGYLTVSLSKKGKMKMYRVHRLVANAFIDNFNNYPIINHKDGNKLNNCVDNLEWCTYKQNIIHSWENGLSYISEKHRQVASKITKERWENYRKSKLERDRV